MNLLMLNLLQEKKPASENYYNIGGYAFKILSYGDFDSQAYLKSMSHLVLGPGSNAEVTIHLIESVSTGLTPPNEWLDWPDINPYNGELLNFGSNRALFNNTELWFVYADFDTNQIYYWVDDFLKLPPRDYAIPLIMVFNLWFANTRFFLCHAAALGIGEKGILLTGKGGSGKSTSTLSCINTEVKLAGDDFLLVDSERFMAHSLYGVAKLNIDQYENLPHLKPLISNIDQVPDEKGQVYVNEFFPNSMISQFRIEAILLPTITGLEDTFIQKCSKTDAIKALVPSSIWILKSDKRAVEKMNYLISQRPTFRLMAGTKLEQIAPTLATFINES